MKPPTLSSLPLGEVCAQRLATRVDGNHGNDVAIANMSLGGPAQDDGDCGRTNHIAEHVAINWEVVVVDAR